MKKLVLTFTLLCTLYANAAYQVCTRACWIGPGHIIAAAYAWAQPADVPCSPFTPWPGAKVYFIEGYRERGKIVILDSGWTDERGMEC